MSNFGSSLVSIFLLIDYCYGLKGHYDQGNYQAIRSWRKVTSDDTVRSSHHTTQERTLTNGRLTQRANVCNLRRDGYNRHQGQNPLPLLQRNRLGSRGRQRAGGMTMLDFVVYGWAIYCLGRWVVIQIVGGITMPQDQDFDPLSEARRLDGTGEPRLLEKR
jgi:hypothetical protein